MFLIFLTVCEIQEHFNCNFYFSYWQKSFLYMYVGILDFKRRRRPAHSHSARKQQFYSHFVQCEWCLFWVFNEAIVKNILLIVCIIVWMYKCNDECARLWWKLKNDISINNTTVTRGIIFKFKPGFIYLYRRYSEYKSDHLLIYCTYLLVDVTVHFIDRN